MITKEYMEGYHWGFTHGRFENKNPYRPGTTQFQDWEEGFSAGHKQRGWL